MGTREVYADFNKLTLQITTDALFGFTPSAPEARTVTGKQTFTQTKRLKVTAAEVIKGVGGREGGGNHICHVGMSSPACNETIKMWRLSGGLIT